MSVPQNLTLTQVLPFWGRGIVKSLVSNNKYLIPPNMYDVVFRFIGMNASVRRLKSIKGKDLATQKEK